MLWCSVPSTHRNKEVSFTGLPSVSSSYNYSCMQDVAASVCEKLKMRNVLLKNGTVSKQSRAVEMLPIEGERRKTLDKHPITGEMLERGAFAGQGRNSA